MTRNNSLDAQLCSTWAVHPRCWDCSRAQGSARTMRHLENHAAVVASEEPLTNSEMHLLRLAGCVLFLVREDTPDLQYPWTHYP